MSDARLIRLSKLLALILRHEPARFGVVLDPEGHAGLTDVLRAVQTRIPDATVDDLFAVVTTVDTQKQRYTIVDGEIRANYGHSLPSHIEYASALPPDVLWHGTSERAVPSIKASGLSPMKRQYVHLTTDPEIATRVGARYGKPRVLRVDAAAAHTQGVVFYRANDTFWLAKAVPACFVS